MSSAPSPVPDTPATRAAQYDLLGHLAGTVAHDFNNVLAAVSGSAGLIEMDPSGPHTPRHLENIRRAVQRGAGILRQLQFFHPRADGPLELTSLSSVLPLFAHSLREQFGTTYPIDVVMREPLPAIHADHTQLNQILLCLASNARDAMPHGGTIEFVVRSVAEPSPSVELSVRDYGTGIDPAIQARLFEPFFTTKPKGKGNGLGLAIVHRLVERHGGTVRFTTAPGEGSTFTCSFPAAS